MTTNAVLEINTKNFKNQNSGTILIVRIPRSKLKLYTDLQEKLLYRWVENNLSIGNIVSSEDGWELLKKTAALIPTVDENGTTTPLDLEAMDQIDYDFYNNVTRLFFTSSVDDEDFHSPDKKYAASLLAKFNHIEYGDTLVKIAGEVTEKRMEEMEEKEKKKTQKKTKTPKTEN